MAKGEAMIVTGGSSLIRRRGRAATAAAGLLGLVVSMLLAGAGSAAAQTGSWTLTGSMTYARAEQTATLLQNGQVLVAGGTSAAAAELYNPATGTWALTGSMSTARIAPVAALLQNGEVLVAAGQNAAGTMLGTAEVYNPATGTWTLTGPMASAPGTGATATLLPNGTVLVAGGCCTPEAGPDALAEAQIYNPATNSWTATGSLSTGRYYATATLLGNGTVLVVGGDYIVPNMNSGNGSSPLDSAEIYNPSTGTWQSAGTTATPHVYATASLLPSGQVLVAGGSASGCCDGVTGADLYTPSTGTWQAAANMNVQREEAAAVVLPNGTVLMTGGYMGDTATPYLTSTEIYQPSTNTWTLGPSMNYGRSEQTATLLPDGQVLVVGGYDGGSLATAELYSAGTTSTPAPVVTGVSPSTGPAAGGTAVTVTGTNLTGGSVAFGGVAATGVSCTASSCSATSPAGSGTVNVTVTTAGGTSATSAADEFSYTASAAVNLIPNPGFESPGTPTDYWGSTVARSQAVVHSGSWSLAQTLTASSGGWDLDDNPSWYASISSADTYTAAIWVYATAAVKVNLSLDLLTSSGSYVDSATGPNVTLTPRTWTQLTVTGIRPTSSEVHGGMEPDFLKGTKGTIIYWDDMSLVVS
jgi:N-acetylneuraminic acid mutarotase